MTLTATLADLPESRRALMSASLLGTALVAMGAYAFWPTDYRTLPTTRDYEARHCLSYREAEAKGYLKRLRFSERDGQGSRTLFRAVSCLDNRAAETWVAPDVAWNVLPWSVAVELDLKPNRLTFDERITIGRQPERAAKTVIKSVRLGEIHATDVAFYITRDDEVGRIILGRPFVEAQRGFKLLDEDSTLHLRGR